MSARDRWDDVAPLGVLRDARVEDRTSVLQVVVSLTDAVHGRAGHGDHLVRVAVARRTVADRDLGLFRGAVVGEGGLLDRAAVGGGHAVGPLRRQRQGDVAGRLRGEALLERTNLTRGQLRTDRNDRTVGCRDRLGAGLAVLDGPRHLPAAALLAGDGTGDGVVVRARRCCQTDDGQADADDERHRVHDGTPEEAAVRLLVLLRLHVSSSFRRIVVTD